MEYVRIPKERIGAVIGKEGKTKKEIEDKLKVTIDIDSDGMVTIQKTEEAQDVLAEWKARDIIKAIGRGINPEIAIKLVRDDYFLEIIDLTEIVGRSRKALIRQKGRIIGTKGKTRKFIEEITGATLSIYGKSVAIVGKAEELRYAKEAVIMLAEGKPHGVVYRFLERISRELKYGKLSLWDNFK